MIKVNGIPFGVEEFQNGEVIFKTVQINDDYNYIRLVYEGNKDIANLQFAYYMIKDKAKDSKVRLNLLYVPYSRMDREEGNLVFSLRYMANILASMKDLIVYFVDAHSPVLVEEFTRAGVNFVDDREFWDRTFRKAYSKVFPDIICMPDVRSYEKYKELCNRALGRELEYIHCEKVGKSSDIEELRLLTGGVDVKYKRVLIVDDICSFGYDLVKTAHQLQSLGALVIYAFVTHAEKNIFLGDIFRTNEITGIMTTDSIILGDESCDGPLKVYNYRWED